MEMLFQSHRQLHGYYMCTALTVHALYTAYIVMRYDDVSAYQQKQPWI